MGQYYGAYTENPNNKDDYHVYMSHGFMKLMEHSWLKNTFVNSVMAHLVENPQKVAWIGDYSNDDYSFFTYGGLSSDEFSEKYNRVFPQEEPAADDKKYTFIKWEDEFSDEQREVKEELVEKLSKAYIVNYSKRRYISLEDYTEAYFNVYVENTWIVHPLPLLTACGNGRGGGDYCPDDGESLSDVGSWAFDVIGVVYNKEEVPADYLDVSTIYLFHDDRL